MNACRAALLLAALTCSAQAAELVNFSADHVTIKVRIPLGTPPNDLGAMTADAPAVAASFCRTYGKYPREISREEKSRYWRYRQIDRAIFIHFACLKD